MVSVCPRKVFAKGSSVIMKMREKSAPTLPVQSSFKGERRQNQPAMEVI